MVEEGPINYLVLMDNLIHKCGRENSYAIGQAKKIAKLNAGDDLVHPFN